MSFLGKTGFLLDNKFEGDELTVRWQVSNFFRLSGKGGDFYESPDFHFSNARWCLEMYPNGGMDPPSENLDLFLTRKKRGPPVTIHYRLSIESGKGVVTSLGGENRFTVYKPSYGWKDVLSRDVLRYNSSTWMPGNALIIACSMNINSLTPARSIPSSRDAISQTDVESGSSTNGKQSFHKRDASIQTEEEEAREVAKDQIDENQRSEKQDASIQTEEEESREAKDQSKEDPEKLGTEKVLEDMLKLLESGEDSDVTVVVGGTHFRAHRAILCVRSPVFSAMFRHNTAEKATDRVTVEDCEPEAFRDFLRHLYAGSARLRDAFGLYRIADRYLAEDLKRRCLGHIRDNLCVRTFSAAVELSLTHREGGLLRAATDFARENMPSILCSVEWQEFMRERPTEANEILIKCYRRPE